MMENHTAIETHCTSCHATYRVPDHFIGKRVACKKCGTAFEMARPGEADNRPLIGKLALKYQLITENQLKEAVSVFNEICSPECLVTFEDVLAERGWISPEQLHMLCNTRDFLEIRQKDKIRGARMVEKGLYSRDQVEMALADQADRFKKNHAIHRIDDILTDPGIRGAKTAEPRAGPETREAVRSEEELRDYRDAFSLSVSEDRLSAWIIKKTGRERKLSLDDINSFLKAKGIIYGIVDDDTLQAFLVMPADPEKPFQIAAGTEPVPGKDAKVTYYFPVDRPKRDMIQQSECVEFKAPEETLSVAPGDILAEKIPLISPTPGMDVFGGQIPSDAVKEHPLRCGEGAVLSEDGLKVMAEIDGHPDLMLDGKILVVSDLSIPGDIDPSSGPVFYNGNIIVSGSVKAGVSVKAGGLTAGEIAGAEIEVNGKVSVANGIVDTRLRARGGVHVKYIKNATVLAYGDVVVEKEITNSEISAGGTCTIPNGRILSSVVSARMGIVAGDVGSEMANPSTLRPGVDVHSEKELETILLAVNEKNKTLEKLDKSAQEVEQSHRRLHQEITKLAQIADRCLLERRSLKEKIEAMIEDGDSAGRDEAEARLKEIKDRAQAVDASLTRLFDGQEAVSENIASISGEISGVQAEISELQTAHNSILQWIRNQKSKPSVTVHGEIFEGTIIKGLRAKRTLPATYHNVLITEAPKTGSDAEDKWEFRVHPRKEDPYRSHGAQLHGV